MLHSMRESMDYGQLLCLEFKLIGLVYCPLSVVSSQWQSKLTLSGEKSRHEQLTTDN